VSADQRFGVATVSDENAGGIGCILLDTERCSARAMIGPPLRRSVRRGHRRAVSSGDDAGRRLSARPHRSAEQSVLLELSVLYDAMRGEAFRPAVVLDVG
jgi:hypothetical protein